MIPADGMPSQRLRDESLVFLPCIQEATHADTEHAATESARQWPLTIALYGNLLIQEGVEDSQQKNDKHSKEKLDAND